MKFIETKDAPLPQGHYSQAVVHNGTVYVSGILPVSSQPDSLKVLSFNEQTDLVLSHLEKILQAAGSTPQNIIQARVYITDIRHWGEFNSRYAALLGTHKPARAVVPVPELHHGFSVELEVMAICE